MHEVIEMFGRRFTVYDLSQRLSNSTSSFQPNSHRIDYMGADDTAALTGRLFGMGPDYWPDGKGYCVETVSLSTHSGTHLDAPYHYGPKSDGTPGRTIDAVPLRWCMGDGVLLDLRHKGPGDGIDRADVQVELRRIGRELKPYDIVLVWTGTDRHFETPGYDHMHPGLRRDATEFLVDAGVRLIGIDAWGLDRPMQSMIEDYRRTGDNGYLWPAHIYGRTREYLQLEKLANLGALPGATGFTVTCFPVAVGGAGAGWTRVVAMPDDG
jgi:kynurenine formamidase